VQVSAEAASGGFIVPNDRVDVVLTRPTGGGQMSETILTNVRILAINANLGSNGASTEGEKASADPASQAFAGGATATLELDPPQAETIINSVALGRLSLMLRPTADDADTANADQQRAANAAIRLTSPFWAGGTAAPVPAAVVPQ
jgi:pilus assembly protein CpaB